MIKRVKESELSTIKDLNIEVLVIEYNGGFEARLGKYSCFGKTETKALNKLADRVMGRVIKVKFEKYYIPMLRSI